VFKDLLKACLLIAVKLSCSIQANTQLPVTIPGSSSVNVISVQALYQPDILILHTQQIFPPSNGTYTVVSSTNDAGHVFFGPFAIPNPTDAYKATHLVFKVFNRWGQLVFATTDWTKKWDGKVGGIPQSTDVYMWMLSYTDKNKKPVFLKGTATLIR
jgi:hypothetical protein